MVVITYRGLRPSEEDSKGVGLAIAMSLTPLAHGREVETRVFHVIDVLLHSSILG